MKVAKFHPAARDALRAFPEDVTPKTPDREIDLGKKRLKEML